MTQMRPTHALMTLCCLAVALASEHGVGGAVSLENQEGTAGPCRVSAWSGAGACSLPCGGGLRTWRRAVIAGNQGCPALLRTTSCNVHPCAGDDASKAAQQKEDDAMETEGHNRRAEYEHEKVEANSASATALNAVADAVKNGNMKDSVTDRLEFRHLVRRTEELLTLKERHYKSSLHQQHWSSLHPPHQVAPDVKPPIQRAATRFSHSYLYENKLLAGEQRLREAKEVTRKVREDLERQPPKGTKKRAQQPEDKDKRYRREMAQAENQFRNKNYKRAKYHYREAIRPELGESAKMKFTEQDFELAEKMLNDKLEAIHEARVRVKGGIKRRGVKTVRQQIDDAVAEAYKQASRKASKMSRLAIKEVKDTTKQQIELMKDKMNALTQADDAKREKEKTKIVELEKTTEKIARGSAAKVKELVDTKAKKKAKAKVLEVENQLAAQEAVKHARAQLDAARHKAYWAGQRAVKVRDTNGTPHQQELADEKALALKERVVELKNEFKLTKKLVQVVPKKPATGSSVKATEKKAEKKMASAATKAKLMESKCSESKTALTRACAAQKIEQALDKNKTSTVMQLSLALLQKEEGSLDNQIEEARNQEKEAADSEGKLAKANRAAKACEEARKNHNKWCGKAKLSEEETHAAKVKAAGDVAAAAKFEAARIAAAVPKGQASNSKLVEADEKADELEKKFDALKAKKFTPVEQSYKMPEPEKKEIEKMVRAGIAAERGGGMVTAPKKNNKARNAAKKAAKLQKLEGDALMKKKSDQEKLTKLEAEAQSEDKEMEAAVKNAEDSAKKAGKDKKEGAEAKVREFKTKRTDMKLAKQQAIQQLKYSIKADEKKSEQLRKKQKAAAEFEEAIKKSQAARSQAKSAEQHAAALAAKERTNAYKATVKAAKIAAATKDQKSRQELLSADAAADAAKKASDLATKATEYVFACYGGDAEKMKLKEKMAASSAPAVKQLLKEKMAVLVKKIDKACEEAKKIEKKSDEAKDKAKKEEKVAANEIIKEEKKAAEAAQSSDLDPSPKRDWKVVRQGNVLTASLNGMPPAKNTDRDPTTNSISNPDGPEVFLL